RGVQQFINNMSSEGLLRVNQEGRLEPWLAEGWRTSADGLSLTVTLRPGMKFHDGSPVDAEIVAAILRDALPKTLKSGSDDVEQISASGQREIQFKFRRPSSFVADSFIDVTIQKPVKPPVGTGPFMPKPGASAEMMAFKDYYLGQPNIDRIVFSTYQNSRAAW